MPAIDEVRGYIDQLLAHGLLQQTDDDYPVLRLTGAGAQLLKDARRAPDLSLSRQRRPEKGARLVRRERARRVVGRRRSHRSSSGCARCGCRLARSRGVPPYVIFHDSTLRELARVKPRSLDELHAVYGMGDRKIELLGAAVLETIRETSS